MMIVTVKPMLTGENRGAINDKRAVVTNQRFSIIDGLLSAVGNWILVRNEDQVEDLRNVSCSPRARMQMVEGDPELSTTLKSRSGSR